MSVYDSFDEKKRFACRVIADHARATAFAIADGILPANEGRNYVLRKIMRRAIYQGRHALGFEDLFFHKVTNFVVDQMGEAYPELEAHREFIDKMVKLEEERFGATLTVGLQKLDELIQKSVQDTGEVGVSTVELAKLYDTFGTPVDLMYVVLSRQGLKIATPFYGEGLQERYLILEVASMTEEEFRAGMERLLTRLQKNATQAQKAIDKANPVYIALSRRRDTKAEFTGYETTRCDNARVVALIKDNEVQSLSEGDEGEVILDQTPFYAESGGQVGDVGKIIEPSLTVGLAPHTRAPG